MKPRPLCFVVMPFRPELNFFYLYIQKYLSEKHSIRVERGDHQILTKPLMDKIRDQIISADVVIADISSGNPNVFYEIGLAHAFAKPVVFLTSEDPKNAPVDVRQFEYIEYKLENHQDFLAKLDNAVQHVFVGNYQELYVAALEILTQFNKDTGSSYAPGTLEDFQARIMRDEQTQGRPSVDDKERMAEFLLPRILRETSDVLTMRKMMEWLSSKP
jgi:hypothetical protein